MNRKERRELGKLLQTKLLTAGPTKLVLTCTGFDGPCIESVVIDLLSFLDPELLEKALKRQNWTLDTSVRTKENEKCYSTLCQYCKAKE